MIWSRSATVANRNSVSSNTSGSGQKVTVVPVCINTVQFPVPSARRCWKLGEAIGQAVRAGRADCGIATRSVAGAAGLDFVPLTWERFDLVLRQRDYFLPHAQNLFGFMRTRTFAERAAELGGYDVTAAGQVRHVS